MRWIALISTLIIISCEVKPQPINYGKEGCVFCKMTIVDNQHSAQLVTVKGKAFKYDAIECMLNDLKEWEHPEINYYLVADYSNPGVLTDATAASYLISESIPSPMGAFLTSFEHSMDRDEIKSDTQGASYNWEEILSQYSISTTEK